MIPLSDDNPTLRTPITTYLLLGVTVATWLLFQGAGFDVVKLAASVCNLGLVPAELTHTRPVGFTVPLGPGLGCAIDDYAINTATPVTSMFLHGSWGHLIGNALFFWVFGNNVEDSMGRFRFLVFYLVCGLAAAAVHVFVDPTSPVPTVGASGAISGILGAYLVLYPRVHVRMLFIFIIFFRVFSIPAWAVLVWWFVVQVITGLPQLNQVDPEISGGVAVWAHVGGFVAGVLLVKLFENRDLVRRRTLVSDARGVWGR
ncbi:MAG: family peptidase [Geminicoccaceae bacterium]|jgi:membrane associated rhomboid family serine protease|nr:family peptidase [Geminicoccaceae bacterium]